jgi:hypothetical protein
MLVSDRTVVVVSFYLCFWRFRGILCAEVLADAVVDLLPLLLFFFALPLGYHASIFR